MLWCLKGEARLPLIKTTRRLQEAGLAGLGVGEGELGNWGRSIAHYSSDCSIMI